MKNNLGLFLIALFSWQGIFAKKFNKGLLEPINLKDNELRLIETEKGVSKWMKRSEIFMGDALGECGAGESFMDITDHQDLEPDLTLPKFNIPQEIGHSGEVNKFIDLIQMTMLKETITSLVGFGTRIYTTEEAAEAADYLKGRYELFSEGRSDISTSFFTHSWVQPSVITRIEGTKNPEQIVIVGGHEDSTVMFSSYGGAPGADDDASGSATVLEVFRALIAGGFAPERTVEFHAYSAEEAGLLGSQDIAAQYQQEGKNVVAMMQLDMTGYTKDPKKDIAVVTDNVDPELTSFVEVLVDNYCTVGWVETSCGYGCSDHASWTKAGYRSTFPFESKFDESSPFIHTEEDLIENVDFDHIEQFVRLGISFATELSYSSLKA